MGMFDTVHFNCPNCGHDIEQQTKAGDRELKHFNQYEVPINIALRFNGTVIYCENCGGVYKLKMAELPSTVELYLNKQRPT